MQQYLQADYSFSLKNIPQKYICRELYVDILYMSEYIYWQVKRELQFFQMNLVIRQAKKEPGANSPK
ncbi:MAG: hypothetical protein ETSY1_46205 (plasmid) [Candidatus Entotheonella factor]|uniref:Uncharacterized protein n=1 Tax=Entotheonella factor TaxID=1429438 RepID=W4M0U8_ENTF1|nr:MAG: hypothetical protein ETSY1_46205 [Candidatus Entotheonella factor]